MRAARAQVPNMRAARAQVPNMRIFGFGENPCKTFPWEGLGGNWYTQRAPGYHTNHSPRKKSGETSWGTDPSTKLCLSGPPFWAPKRAPGLPGPRSRVWSPKMVSGVKHTKVAGRKSIQKSAVNAPNGAICCKSWPITILKRGAQIWRAPGCLKRAL